MLFLGEQVAVAGVASLGTCSNESPGASSYLAAMPCTGMLFCFEQMPPTPGCSREVNQSSGIQPAG